MVMKSNAAVKEGEENEENEKEEEEEGEEKGESKKTDKLLNCGKEMLVKVFFTLNC